jgi:hypothetical protein
MSKKKQYIYICTYSNEEFGLGDSLEEAYNSMQNSFGGERSVDDCAFHELGEKIEVEMKLIPKVVAK